MKSMSFAVKYNDKRTGGGTVLILTPDGSVETARRWMSEIQEKVLPGDIAAMYGPFEVSAEDVLTTQKLSPSLARTYKGLIEATKKYGRAVGGEEVAKDIGLSRNLVSAYLTDLVNLGIIERIPNLDKNLKYRWLFKGYELDQKQIEKETLPRTKTELSMALARTKSTVYNLFGQTKNPVTADKVAKELGLSVNLVRNYLKQLAEINEIERLPNVDSPKEARFAYIPKDEIRKKSKGNE